MVLDCGVLRRFRPCGVIPKQRRTPQSRTLPRQRQHSLPILRKRKQPTTFSKRRWIGEVTLILRSVLRRPTPRTGDYQAKVPGMNPLHRFHSH
jgi:hypothetical protein